MLVRGVILFLSSISFAFIRFCLAKRDQNKRRKDQILSSFNFVSVFN